MQKINEGLNNLFLICLSAFILLIPFSKQAAKIVFVSASLWVLINILESKLKFYKYLIPKTSLNKPLLFFFLTLLASTIFSINFYHSQSIFTERFLIYLSFLFLGHIFIESQKGLNIFIGLIVLSSLIIGVGGVWSSLQIGGRLLTFFGLSINYSVFLLLYIPLNCTVAFFGKNKVLRSIAGVNTLLLFSCLIWHASRGVWLAILCSVLAVFSVKGKRGFLFLIICLIILSFFIPASVKQRAISSFDTNFWGDRLALWKAAIAIFEDFPIFGAGPGMYEKLLYGYGPLSGYSESFIHLHAHSTYFQVVSELGIVGLISFLAIFFIFLKNIVKSLKLSGDGNIGAVKAGLGAGIFAALIFALASSIITVGIQSAVIFWFILGVATGLNPKEQSLRFINK